MIGKEVIETEPISGAKVKEVLEEFSEDNELNYEQNITLNHLARFKRYSVEDSEEIIEKLQSEFNLRPKVAVHIVDLVPQDLADLRLIFAKEPGQFSKEDMEKILELLGLPSSARSMLSKVFLTSRSTRSSGWSVLARLQPTRTMAWQSQRVVQL